MDIFKTIIELNLPTDKYVVVGSGIMIALGLKEATDLDIEVSPDLFEEYKNGDWETVPWTYMGHEGEEFLRKGDVEIYLDICTPDYKKLFADLRKDATIINGIPFMSMQDTLNLKREYSKTKPKHLIDIKIIEDYLDKKL